MRVLIIIHHELCGFACRRAHHNAPQRDPKAFSSMPQWGHRATGPQLPAIGRAQRLQSYREDTGTRSCRAAELQRAAESCRSRSVGKVRKGWKLERVERPSSASLRQLHPSAVDLSARYGAVRACISASSSRAPERAGARHVHTLLTPDTTKEARL